MGTNLVFECSTVLMNDRGVGLILPECHTLPTCMNDFIYSFNLFFCLFLALA